MSFGQTFSLLMVMVVLAFCMAASSISQLQLSGRFEERVRSDALARAAVSEFVLRSQQRAGPVSMAGTARPVLEQFSDNEQLLRPDDPRLQADCRLRRDLCLDNLENSLSVAGRFGSKVPPYTLSVAYELKVGRHNYLYETLLQRRWPYAVAGVGPIVICGKIDRSNTLNVMAATPLPEKYFCRASTVQGSILGYPERIYRMTEDVIPVTNVDLSTLIQMLSFATAGVPQIIIGGTPEEPEAYRNRNRVSLGGKVLVYDLIGFAPGDADSGSPGATINLYQQQTNGVEVTGNVDLINKPRFQSRTEATVDTVGGTLTGSQRINPPGIPSDETLAKILEKPETGDWNLISASASPSQTLSLSGSSLPGAQVIASGRARISHSVAFPDLSLDQPNREDLRLNNIELAVDGDLTVKGKLYGSSATLIVDGALTMEDATLDSGGNGLVIFCRRLICRANGELHGLIVAQQGAALYSFRQAGDPPDAHLLIDGGIIAGGTDVAAQAAAPSGPPMSVRSEALTLVNTEVKYNPRYLRNLNGAGSFVVLATTLRQ
ncbi:MAG: hypothetical protein J0I12_05845 [Candidatus Eremiobacteraeota bacterium]|nr:hypothetical protein [Candidatus Eremiobacteraeota bacterium]